jgi:hypothetical protein
MEAFGRNAITMRICCLFIRFDGQTACNSRDIRRSRNRDGSVKLPLSTTTSPLHLILPVSTLSQHVRCAPYVCIGAVVVTYFRSGVGKGKSGKVGGKSGKVGATEGDSKSQSRSSKAGRKYSTPCIRTFSCLTSSHALLFVPQSSSPSAVSIVS